MYQDSPPATETHPHASPAQPSKAEPQTQARVVFPSLVALASMLDHTLLKPEVTQAQVLALAEEAAEHRFACAMINPVWVPAVCRVLAGAGVRTGTVLGFPLGASLSATKCAEAQATAQAGALDLDMVLNIGALRSGMFNEVREDVEAVAEVAHGEGAILKVILETSLLDDVQKRVAAELCMEAHADFVKTSTGFSTGGATIADVQLLRKTVGERCGVKASGGIRTLGDAVQMVSAGANRIGTSGSVAILQAYQALLLQ